MNKYSGRHSHISIKHSWKKKSLMEMVHNAQRLQGPTYISLYSPRDKNLAQRLTIQDFIVRFPVLF